MSIVFELIVATEAELEMLRASPDDVSAFVDDVPESKRLSLDKTWHGLHFLLTGTSSQGAPPLNFLASGDPVGTFDGEPAFAEGGDGTPRAYSRRQVAELATALAMLSEADLRDRFDADAMMSLDIYPAIWERNPNDDDTFGW